VDGNFKADHMKMRQPDGDVALTDGQGYFVEDAPYKQHLETATEIKQVRTHLLHPVDTFFIIVLETNMYQSQGCQRGKIRKEELGLYWCRGCCLRSPWLLHSSHHG
jgi:hypothetical protein